MPTKNFEEFTIYAGVGEPVKFTGITTIDSEESLGVGTDRIRISDSELGSWEITPSGEAKYMTIPLASNAFVNTITSCCAPRTLRLHCEYCGCVSSKDFGTCEHCGAPLVPMEYYI